MVNDHSSAHDPRLRVAVPWYVPGQDIVELAYQYFGVTANSTDEEVRTAYRDKCQRIMLMHDQVRAQQEMVRCQAHYQVLRQRRNMIA